MCVRVCTCCYNAVISQLILLLFRKLGHLQLFFLPHFASMSILTLHFLPCPHSSPLALEALEAEQPNGSPSMMTRSNNSRSSQICHRVTGSLMFRQSQIPKLDKKSADGLTVGKALASAARLRVLSQWGKYHNFIFGPSSIPHSTSTHEPC